MNCAAHQLVKLVKKLERSNFAIKPVGSKESYSPVAQLQQSVFVSELGYPKETGEEPDDYEHLSTRFIACLGDAPIGTFRLTQRQLSDSTMPIEAHLDICSIIGNATAMEVSKFMLLPDYRGRCFCLAMMACCLSYAEKNNITYTFATTVPGADALFAGAGFKAFAEPFYKPQSRTYTTPRVMDLETGHKLLGELMAQLKQAKIIP